MALKNQYHKEVQSALQRAHNSLKNMAQHKAVTDTIMVYHTATSPKIKATEAIEHIVRCIEDATGYVHHAIELTTHLYTALAEHTVYSGKRNKPAVNTGVMGALLHGTLAVMKELVDIALIPVTDRRR